MVTRLIACTRPSSPEIVTSQIQVVRPLWIGRATASRTPSAAGRRNRVSFDLAEADLAVRRDRPVGAAGGERLGDAGVDPAVDDPGRLMEVLLDRQAAPDQVLAALDHLEPVMGVER